MSQTKKASQAMHPGGEWRRTVFEPPIPRLTHPVRSQLGVLGVVAPTGAVETLSAATWNHYAALSVESAYCDLIGI